MKHELSTVGGGLAAKSKKGEGKKRAFPLNPYREKAKPKEIKPGVNSTGLSRMRTHARRCGAKAMISAAVEEALREFHGTRGPAPSDEALWAGFAWRLGVGKFLDPMPSGAKRNRTAQSAASGERDAARPARQKLAGYGHRKKHLQRQPKKN